ncbi:GL19093 [Drosophila persimilis]|uniref:Profilin n=1 Tax=Drosophila persimilis TaxID=7234 RepID=B4G6L5_DROPE|nr:GL19093 [Drosophila persimilis]
MSWQDYVDNQLLASQCVTKGVHCRTRWQHLGRSLLALRFKPITKEELAKLISGFDQQDILTSNGVTLAGQRYIYLSGTDRVVRAKLGRSGVHCMKTTQAVIVSIYEDPVQPQQAASVVEKLGDYLITCGY